MESIKHFRKNNRTSSEIRFLEFEPNYLSNAEGSCLVKLGDTWVVCTATIDDKLPHFKRNSGSGWITAEYGMLPRSTDNRMQREAMKGKQGGRTQEIQRLISRSLRAAVDLSRLGDRQIIIDCDVIKADGGTRTAAINGGYIAMYLALKSLFNKGLIRRIPIIKHVTAVSCGIVKQQTLLDLDYNEDSGAEVDSNFVLASDNSIIEVQCTAEQSTFNDEQMLSMLELAKLGCKQILTKQMQAIGLA